MGENLVASSALCAGALCCWKMKNSLEIRSMAGRNCCNSVALRLMLLDREASNWCNVNHLFLVTDAISDWTLNLCAQAFCHDLFLLAWWICVFVQCLHYSRSIREFVGVVTVNIFSSVNKNDANIIGWIFLSNCFEWCRVLRRSSLYSALGHRDFWAQIFHKVM